MAYLGALEAGSPVLLTAPAAAPGLTAAYDPDVSWSLADGLREHRRAPATELHEDLALLLSTSGTTGSPKLVRLSRANVLANARAIVDYLAITARDAPTTVLPLHYCYGLSVCTATCSRARACCSPTARSSTTASGPTSAGTAPPRFAGVPYTFELLDRVGFADLDLPRPALPHPGRRPARARGRASLRRASAASAGGTSS